jgi:hypothetical protein
MIHTDTRRLKKSMGYVCLSSTQQIMGNLSDAMSFPPRLIPHRLIKQCLTPGGLRIVHTIELDDSYLNITYNLHEVLNRFRELTKPRLLWVDAICIDQGSIPERNRQVALMGRIYMQAAEVLIYLGQEQYEREKVPALLKDIREVAPLLNAEKVDIRASKFTLTDYGLPPQDDKRWLPVVLLWIRPWFGRLWVMQECVLSERPIIHCGSWAVNWNPPHILQAIIDVCTSQFRNLIITIPFPQALR